MRFLVMLVLMLGVTAANAAPTRPVWICTDASGVSAAQDHQCAPNQTFLRGYNRAQAPQVVTQPKMAVTAPARVPKFAPIKTTDAGNIYAPILRIVWQGVFVMIVVLIAITAAKVYLFRAGHQVVRGFFGDKGG